MKILKNGVLSIILCIALSSSSNAQELEQIYYAPRALDLRKEIDSLLDARISIEKEALPFNSELKEAIEKFNMAFKKDAGSVLTKTS
ncbi:hypothetical protein, partial [Sphingobacterium siyangense]|uniref:hypothetical protein n=1 Tax=Sphingobacterium siyangense TaxID=459529 RepID=UPI003C72846C